jgi:helicase-like protein
MDSLALVAIDELHLVSEWGKFRPQYRVLHLLRARVDLCIPFLGVSATLDFTVLQDVKEAAGFNNDISVERTSMDRPEIYLEVDVLKHDQISMLDLLFLLPVMVTRPQDIPKTIIYMNDIKSIQAAVKIMRRWMNELGYPPEAEKWVQPYFSIMAKGDKQRISQEFAKLDEDCSSCRIIIATDAYGLGIDNPDVRRVVQWLLPPTMSALYQRMGRAMRCGRGSAVYTLLHPAWCIGSISECPGSRGNKKKDIEKRQKMPPGLQWFLNSHQCLRKTGLAFFQDMTYSCSAVQTPTACCSFCHPAAMSVKTTSMPQHRKNNGDTLYQPWRAQKLRLWREQKSEDMFPNSIFAVASLPQAIMSDNILANISKFGSDIKDMKTLIRWGGPWPEAGEFWREIVALVEIPAGWPSFERSEAYLVWKHQCDIKAKRVVPDIDPIAQREAKRLADKEDWLIQKGYKKGGRKQRKSRTSKRKTGLDEIRDQSNSQASANLSQSATTLTPVIQPIIEQQQVDTGARQPLMRLDHNSISTTPRGRKRKR